MLIPTAAGLLVVCAVAYTYAWAIVVLLVAAFRRGRVPQALKDAILVAIVIMMLAAPVADWSVVDTTMAWLRQQFPW